MSATWFKNVVYPFNGLLLSHRKKRSTNTCRNTEEPWECCAECRKPLTKGHILSDSTHRKCPEQARPQRQKVDEWWSRAWRERDRDDGCTTLWIYENPLSCILQMGEYYGMGIISIKRCIEPFPHGSLLGCLEHSTVYPRNKTSKGIWIKYYFKLGRRQHIQIPGRDWVKRGQKELHARVCMCCLRKGHALHRRGEGAGGGRKNFTSNEQSLLKQEPINLLLHRCTPVCLPHHHLCYEAFLYSYVCGAELP